MIVRLIQRVGIDVDDVGEELGDGAALVDLAVFERPISLPFLPFPGLTLELSSERVVVEEVRWVEAAQQLVCEAEPIWTQTRTGADDIVESLIAAGFSPVDQNHRETDVH